jgi:hypothetical protein
MLTFEEVVERLKTFDEVTLLELFDLSSEELVELLRDDIERNFEFYHEQVSTNEDTRLHDEAE